ncbi:beta-D-glucoside glucohydrolase [Lophium mytilinum]|uniref:beta-glucosidase n=1 Tax=Lophium mytilinum TaxID=390894 RepID=A0A6A6QYV2_9PEZI|nr:beta-D-glucoside glucohydrolase [Lophium mytilinum]
MLNRVHAHLNCGIETSSAYHVHETKRTVGDWESAYSKATAALAKLSSSDKINIVTGVGWQGGKCVGNTAAVSSINYPSLCLQDGPLGVRYVDGVTALPAGIQAAATWDTALMNQRGAALGEEAKALGIHVQLGPVAGPLGKIPQGGRNWEGFSPDPYLTGIAMQQTITGMQGAGVQACAKHFIGNEQEHNRETMSSNIDDRTMHELYLWPFADAVQAKVASFMCSYNKVNSTFACENDKLLNGILKGELGFQGYVMSDWNAQHTTAGSANSGMDMTMPGSDFNKGNVLWGPALTSAISSNQVSQSRVDDMVKRILAAWYLLGQDSGYPTASFDSWNIGTHDVQGTHKTVARAIARDGIVLLKNTNNALPLKKPASLAIIGSDAIQNPNGINSCADRQCNTGTLAMGWGSGTAEFPYLVAPLDAIKTQASADGTTLSTSTTDSTTAGASAASAAATAIVFITADSGEGYITVETNAGDRNNLDPWHSGNDLVKAVAAVNANTIVVIHSVGPIILESIIALDNVKAVVWAGLPGQESGNGLVDVLYGSTAPSGKLPFTIAKTVADYGTSVVSGDDNFSEGLYIDYRHFDKNSISPRFEFGFGLSYTNFTYSALSITSSATSGPASSTSAGDLFDIVATVTATITNSGSVTGAEVAQLYVTLPSSAPSSPPKQLRGFAKLSLAAGSSGTAKFELRRKDLSYWNGASWVVPSGEFGITVGASSRDGRLTGTLTV